MSHQSKVIRFDRIITYNINLVCNMFCLYALCIHMYFIMYELSYSWIIKRLQFQNLQTCPISLYHEWAIVARERGSTNIHMRRPCLRYQLWRIERNMHDLLLLLNITICLLVYAIIRSSLKYCCVSETVPLSLSNTTCNRSIGQ